MRSFRSEMASLAVTLSVPALVFVAFPYEAFSFRAISSRMAREMTVSYVSLSPAEERQAVQTARASLRGEGGNVRWMRADVSGDLSAEEVARPILSALAPERSSRMELLPCGRIPYLPSQRACSVEKIDRMTEGTDSLPFSRTELLRIE